MLKLVDNIRRRSDVEPEEFYRYWKDEHGPLVRSVADVLGIRRYVQSHTVDTPINGKGTVPGGKLGLTVDGTYKDAFGC